MEVRGQNAQDSGYLDQEQQESGDYEISSNCSGEAGSYYFGSGLSSGLSSIKNDVSYLPESSKDVSVGGGSSRHTYSTVWDKLSVDYDNISYSLRGGKIF